MKMSDYSGFQKIYGVESGFQKIYGVESDFGLRVVFKI